MRIPYTETIVQREIRENRKARSRRIDKDIDRYGRDILDSKELKEAFRQTHHLWSTVGEHTMRVAQSSLRICYALRKLRIKTDIPEVIIGSLCHDLGILGRYDKYDTERECLKEHPQASVKVARELVPDLSEKSADIIERHMWPAGRSLMPNSIESAIVSVADKHVAVKDLIKGSEIKNTGIKNKFNAGKEKVKNNIIYEDPRRQ